MFTFISFYIVEYFENSCKTWVHDSLGSVIIIYFFRKDYLIYINSSFFSILYTFKIQIKIKIELKIIFQ